MGMGDDWVINGRLTKGGIREFWLTNFPPWLTCVVLIFCVEVVMIEDVKVGTLGKDVGIGIEWLTWLVA